MTRADRSFLPYGRQEIDEADIQAVVDVLRGDFLTTGPQVPLFEESLCKEFGAEFSVACSSGTAALHLAVMAVGVGPGDYVVVPSVTFLATANVVSMCGGKVVFADVDPCTGLMMPNNLLEAIERVPVNSLKAIINVHLNGQTGDPEGLYRVAQKMGVPLIEDACHAAGSSYRDVNGDIISVGAAAHSDMVAFSFHPVKTLTTAEGGAVLTNDAHFADALRSLRNHGMVKNPESFKNNSLGFDHYGNPNPWYYELHAPGLNYRLNDIQAALGISQLRKLKHFADRRESLVRKYDTLLEGRSNYVTPVARIDTSLPVWHLYVVRIDFLGCGRERSSLMGELRSAGVGTQVHYLPLHMQPFYQDTDRDLVLPGAESYYFSALSLPLFPSLNEKDIEHVVDALSKAVM